MFASDPLHLLDDCNEIIYAVDGGGLGVGGGEAFAATQTAEMHTPKQKL